MKKIVAFVLLFSLPFVSAAASDLKPYEMPRTHVAPIHDDKNGRQYELYIKLPEEYADNTDATYPVIYTGDAKWHMDMLSGATEYLLPDVILVGISWQTDLGHEREHASRFRDYTVIGYSDAEAQAEYKAGQASKHLSFIRNDVFNYIESNYRADPEQRTYFGFSLGAIIGAYAVLAEPDSFNNYILGSPAFGERSANYIDELEVKTARQQDDLGVNVFVSIGELEVDEMALNKEFITVLKRRSRSGLALTGLEVIKGADHAGAFPETAIRGVKWLSQLGTE